jgi:2-octaprenylphenol hydroxylase
MKLAVATRWCATLWCGSNRRPSRSGRVAAWQRGTHRRTPCGCTGCCATPCPGGRHAIILCMKFDVVIIGGGLVGASLAAALKHSGLSLALVESQSLLMPGGASAKKASSPLPNPLPVENPSPQSSGGTTSHSTKPSENDGQVAGYPASGRGSERERFSLDDWDNRIYAISPGSRRFLEQSGAWSLLDTRRIAPVEAMRVFGDTGGELEFSAYQMGVAELACILENRALQHALWEVLQQQENLTLLHPARCASLQFAADEAMLALEDGRTLSAKLIVGADGRDSWVRNQAGISAAPLDYRQHGVVANFSCSLPHRGIAYQWFQPDGILALLPLPGNRVSMVWSVSPEQSGLLLAMTQDELCAQVAAASRHTLGELSLVTPPAAFPLRLLVLPQISAPRVALIGDAAHNMHPLAGQGVNTGFRDARQLAQILLERGAQNDCGNVQLLRSYERKRKEDIYTMQAATYGLKHLFNNDVPLLSAGRNFGLNSVNHFAPLKKMLMQHALN